MYDDHYNTTGLPGALLIENTRLPSAYGINCASDFILFLQFLMSTSWSNEEENHFTVFPPVCRIYFFASFYNNMLESQKLYLRTLSMSPYWTFTQSNDKSTCPMIAMSSGSNLIEYIAKLQHPVSINIEVSKQSRIRAINYIIYYFIWLHLFNHRRLFL